MKLKEKVRLRSFLVLLLVGSFWVSACKSDQPNTQQLPEQVKKLQDENAKLKSEIELLKVQLSNPAVETTSSPTPVATKSPTPVAFEDIDNAFGEKAITQLAQLGVFDTISGKFNPQKPITRAEFVRWLVRANNAIFAGVPSKTIPLPNTGKGTFSDIPPTHPDFPYIQGMADAGLLIGYDEKTFKPDEILTREQMLALKVALDHRVAIDAYISSPPGGWTDSNKISKKYWQALYVETTKQNSTNIKRTFGEIEAFKPQAPVTRAEAAVSLSAIGDNVGSFTSAAEALQKKAQ